MALLGRAVLIRRGANSDEDKLGEAHPLGHIRGEVQAAGLMVNYLYDLTRIETSHDRFVQGRVVHSRALSALL